MPKPYYFTPADMDRVRAYMPTYRWAVLTVGGLTPLMMAPIHKRECGLRRQAPILRRTGKRLPGGPFQYDPGGGGPTFRARINAHVRKVCKQYGVPYADIDNDFRLAVLVAADILKEKAKAPLVVNGRGVLEVVADAYWGYNGRSGWHTPDGVYEKKRRRRAWQYSNYVCNDPKAGKQMRIRGTLPDGKGGRIQIDSLDQNPGALVLYREIRERLNELDLA